MVGQPCNPSVWELRQEGLLKFKASKATKGDFGQGYPMARPQPLPHWGTLGWGWSAKPHTPALRCGLTENRQTL